MADEHVLRVPLEEPTAVADSVLVHVSAPSKDGGALLVEGTEGETPYVGTFSPSSLAACRAPNSSLPSTLWSTTLTHLLQHGPAPALPSPRPTLTLTASLTPSTSLTLHLRQTIAGSGVVQRLGALTLAAAPDHEIDTLAWTGIAIQRAENLSGERDAAQAEAAASAEREGTLRREVEELITAKKETEDTLLVAFADVLNAKKRKIRELLRCVEALQASDGAANGSKTEAADEGTTDRPAATRKGKRKATPSPDPPEEPADDSDSEDFERMHSPGAQHRADSTERESDTDEDVPMASSPPSPQPRRGVGRIGGVKWEKDADDAGKEDGTTGHRRTTSRGSMGHERHESGGTQRSDDGPAQAGKRATQQETGRGTHEGAPPPPRDLPFTRAREAAEAAVGTDGAEGDVGADEDEEESDDEL